MSVFSTSIGDDLLRWASEAGTGSWERLREVCSYLTHKHQKNRRPWVVASELAQLGHLEINWKERIWSVTPPVLNLVPGLGLCLVLTGSRPHYVDQRFEEATDSMDVFPFVIAQGDAPLAKYAKCASVEIAQRTAERFGSQLVIDPASQLMQVFQPIDEIPLKFASPPALDEAERFDPATLQWRSQHNRQPGLYRLDLHGRKAHRRLDHAGIWSDVELPVGQFLELHTHSKPLLRWRRPRRGELSYLEIRRELSLPLVAERAAVISSGVVLEPNGDWRRYPNVPENIAQLIAKRLLTRLEIL
jgi:hypothetical protein